MRRRIFRLALTLVVSVLVVVRGNAAFVQLSGPYTLDNLVAGQSFVVGDKLFSNFDFFGFASGGALPPDLANFYVFAGQDSITHDYGLLFRMAWNAAAGQTVNGNIAFGVSVFPPQPEPVIKDVTLLLTGASATGPGVVNVSETVFSPSDVILASISATKQHDVTPPDPPLDVLFAHADFAPQHSITIHKDISISGGTTGSAHLSELYQYFSQIVAPEPSSFVLLSSGSVALAWGLWRTSARTRKRRNRTDAIESAPAEL